MKSVRQFDTIFSVTSYRRRLPHRHPPGKPLFLIWRLQGSLPSHRAFPPSSLSSGKAFVALDRLLDQSRTGPRYLCQPEIAQLVVDALQYGQDCLRHYTLQAFVVMPNHVHVLLTPQVPVPKLLRSLKGITAKRANQLLGLAGRPFWQDESYDHVVRDDKEMERIRAYIEQNPVKAGLAIAAEQYRWSSACGQGAGQGAGCGPGGPPHKTF